MVKSKQFNDTIEGLTIYVEEKNENGILKNIFIRDDGHVLKSLENSKNSNNVTIFAKEGKIEQIDNPPLEQRLKRLIDQGLLA